MTSTCTRRCGWRARRRKPGVKRYLFSSSCSLYGAGGDGFLDETAAFHPVTAYGESKVRVEQEVAGLADANFTPVYLRNATAYGVSRRLRADIVVNNLVGYAVTTGKVLLQSDGTPWRPLVHIGDIIHAFICCLAAPKDAIHNQAFNVGRKSENFRIREVAETVAAVVPNSQVSYAPGASADTRDYRVDFTKIETKLPGYSPKWTLRKGVEELYAAYTRASPEQGRVDGPALLPSQNHQGLAGSPSDRREPAADLAAPAGDAPLGRGLAGRVRFWRHGRPAPSFDLRAVAAGRCRRDRKRHRDQRRHDRPSPTGSCR